MVGNVHHKVAVVVHPARHSRRSGYYGSLLILDVATISIFSCSNVYEDEQMFNCFLSSCRQRTQLYSCKIKADSLILNFET
jgi:hypothetical protein